MAQRLLSITRKRHRARMAYVEGSRHGTQQVVGDSMPDRREKGDKRLPLNPSRTMCPFLSDPFEECLCRDMGSLMALAVIRICGDDFQSCKIYKTEISRAGNRKSRNG